MKVKFKFIKDASGIKKGEVRNLPIKTGEACIALGVAEYVTKPKAKETKEG